MDIRTHDTPDACEVHISGRLDAYWADHLTAALDDAVRNGKHRIRLNMADVSYMSSVGVRVLLRFYKQLQNIHGSFSVVQPSAAVQSVLELAGLDAVLVTQTASAEAPARPAGRRFEREHAAFEVFDLEPGATLSCRVVGDARRLADCRFDAAQSRTLAFPGNRFGVGLGAFGHSFVESQARFGEFLCAAGAAAYLPTDGTNVPDSLVTTGALVPELSVLYGLVCEGRFARQARFEAAPGSPPFGLSALAEAAAEIAEAEVAGVVVLAETAGLMGAALRRSPAAPSPQAPTPSYSLFSHPQIREWLSFTPERAYARSLAFVVGVVARTPHPGLVPLLRPLGAAPWPAGHFHAAAFSYRPVQQGQIDLESTVTGLFEGEALQGVLHLLNDDRPIVGGGESAFVRGACWVGPIAEVVEEP